MKSTYIPFAMLLTIEILALLAYGLNFLSLNAIYACAIAVLGAALVLSYKRMFPFGADKKIANKTAWLGLATMPIMSIGSVANSEVILFWYPTSHRIWALFPLIVYGAICLRYKLII